MFASPLVSIVGNNIDPSMQLNYRKEFEWIDDNSFAKVIQHKMICATEENLDELSEYKPNVIHFSGHGDIVNEKEANTINKFFGKLGHNYLLFEDKNLASQIKMQEEINERFVSQQMLKHLKLVFISSCHSEGIGKLLFEAGVEHVICVK